MDSIYWVVSRDCNQRCAHCYNNSEPGAPGLINDEVTRCIEHLPEPGAVRIERIILSGGEVLVWPDLLFHTLRLLNDRYAGGSELWVQTNGDLLDEAMLERLLEHHVRRVDVSSIDSYHPKSTLARQDYLTRLFESRGMRRASDENTKIGTVTYGFWGATEEQWIGPLWPRGRARQNGLSAAGPEHEFCRMWSGARNFLNYREAGCELNVQLADVYPCCPMTCRPLGSLLHEPLVDMLDRCAKHPVFQALNEGRPEKMGESMGISEEHGFRRSRELGNHCLWCDEFFTSHAPELLLRGATTERNTVDLQVELAQLHAKHATPSTRPSKIAERPFYHP